MDLLTTSEAAERLHVTPVRVRQMIREGKIEAKQVGRDYIIEESSLESVKTYGKAGRPKGANGKPKTENEKPFKTIFDVAPELVGCLESGISDLGSNKKHLDGFGTKEAEKRGLLSRGKNNR